MTSTDHAVIHRTPARDADRGLRIPARYRHDWMLFADWCTATDHSPVPATPETLAGFLREHPAAVATQRRRLSAINAVHTVHGYPPPGRTETVRRHLDVARGLLVLAATGMSFTDITRLRRRDVSVDDGVLVVTIRGGERFRIPPDPETGESLAVAIYRRWANIQTFLDENPGTQLLRHHLIAPTQVVADPLDLERAQQPLLCPIDRWGHLPHDQPMTAQSVSALVRAHLSGRAPIRRALPVPRRDRAEPWVEPYIDLDPTYYDRGIAGSRPACATTRISRTSPMFSTRSTLAPTRCSTSCSPCWRGRKPCS